MFSSALQEGSCPQIWSPSRLIPHSPPITPNVIYKNCNQCILPHRSWLWWQGQGWRPGSRPGGALCRHTGSGAGRTGYVRGGEGAGPRGPGARRGHVATSAAISASAAATPQPAAEASGEGCAPGKEPPSPELQVRFCQTAATWSRNQKTEFEIFGNNLSFETGYMILSHDVSYT